MFEKTLRVKQWKPDFIYLQPKASIVLFIACFSRRKFLLLVNGNLAALGNLGFGC